MKIGNFELVSYLNGLEMLRYKFHKSANLMPGMGLNLWSMLSEFKKHYPPTDFIMTCCLKQENKENIIDESTLWSFSSSNNLIIDVLLDENENVIRPL